MKPWCQNCSSQVIPFENGKVEQMSTTASCCCGTSESSTSLHGSIRMHHEAYLRYRLQPAMPCDLPRAHVEPFTDKHHAVVPYRPTPTTAATPHPCNSLQQQTSHTSSEHCTADAWAGARVHNTMQGHQCKSKGISSTNVPSMCYPHLHPNHIHTKTHVRRVAGPKRGMVTCNNKHYGTYSMGRWGPMVLVTTQSACLPNQNPQHNGWGMDWLDAPAVSTT